VKRPAGLEFAAEAEFGSGWFEEGRDQEGNRTCSAESNGQPCISNGTSGQAG